MSSPAEADDTPACPTQETDTAPYPSPVTHGVGVSYHHEDTGLYDAVRALWVDEVGSQQHPPADERVVADVSPGFVPDSEDSEYVLVLTSKGWKAGVMSEIGAYTQSDAYLLMLKRRGAEGDLRDAPVSLTVTLRPQFEELVYPNGNRFPLPHGTGTSVRVQTTYPNGPDDVRTRVAWLLRNVFDGREYNYTPSTEADATGCIWKLEKHIRFDIDRLEAVVECLERSRELTAYGGAADQTARQDRDPSGYLETSLTSDRWDLLGFQSTGYEEFAKVYRIDDWANRESHDPLHHPKLEVAYDGGTGSKPKLAAWNEVAHQLAVKVVQHARWAGVEPSDLIADEFFAGPDAPVEEYPAIEGRRDDLRARYASFEAGIYQEVTARTNHAREDILSVLVEREGATYNVLVTETGLSRSSVQRYVREFAECGFVKRVSNPVVVVFTAPYVLDVARDVIEAVSAGETVGDRRAARAERRKERKEQRAQHHRTDNA